MESLFKNFLNSQKTWFWLLCELKEPNFWILQSYSPGRNICQMNIIGADGAEAGQNLCKRGDNKILAMSEK